MKRSYDQAPTRQDVADGTCDIDYLIGPYKRLLLGRSTNAVVRQGAASGGVITELLCELFESDRADAVLSVGFEAGDPVNPRYLASRTSEQLRERAGSVYSYISPAELKRVGAEVTGERVAIVCQPCLVPLVRRWKEQGELDVVAVVSFFCGYNMSHAATHYLLGKAKVLPQDVAWIHYRHGEYPGGFGVRAKDGREVCFGKESYELVNLQFVRSGCSRCSLYMGEGADISCGDAWLKEHQGFTAVMARSDVGLNLLEAAKDRLEFYDLPEKTLLHMHLHNLIYKKHGNSLFLRLLTLFFRDILPKYWAPFRLLSRLSGLRRRKKIGVGLPELRRVEDVRE